MYECASDLVKEIQKKNGQPFHHDHLLSISQINNSLSLLFGRRLDMEKEKDKIEITHKMSDFMMEAFASTNITFNDPSFAPLLLLFNYKKITEGMNTLRKSEGIFEKEIEMRLHSKDDQRKEDFIGCFLQEIEKRNKTNQPHTFTLESLQGNMFLLYNAGLDSTLASVGWLLLLMAGHPDIQAKICKEIDRTIGRDGVVYYDDRVNLPYTLATVYEMMRYITINPIFPPRYTLEDLEYGGYTIPKGSHIICNSWALLHDPRYHEDPMEFKPERFLSENGTKLKRMDGYGPFSFGKRNCPGEGVAMMTTYLYFVSIMQKFNIKTPTGGPPDMTYNYSAGTRPVPQNLWIQSRNYPPGPFGLPLLGYWPFLGKYPNKTLCELSKKYGDIFSFYIGTQHMICVNDFRMSKEILNHPLTLARPPHSFDFITSKAGFGGLNGEEWQEQRGFILSTMRNLNVGKGLWETMIQDCASDLVKEIQKKKGQQFNLHPILLLSQINNSLSLLFGRRLDMEKERYILKIARYISDHVMEVFSSTNLTLNNPFLAHFRKFFHHNNFQEFIYILRRLEELLGKEVKKRVNSKEDPSKEDFIGCYLQEMEKRNKTDQPHTFTWQDSTLASVGWLLLLMSGHPDIQAKVCEEIDRTIGTDGVVYYDDRGNLPYTLATVYEMMRYIAINPVFPPRYVLDDFEFGGYTVPKGSHIICNSWAFLHDSRYYEDPMEFKPERFLIENETKLKRMDDYGPFSFGKRNCPGEGVAMMTIYLYFVSIMHKFHIKTPTGGQPDMTYKYSSGTKPCPQNLCFIER
ncbi:hypothetical protein JTE90_023404 [Oedothorax gibbosus]|uniref:Cytochrome P450 n=1 Tax=Oedothorax gibbosus TaxID=931172 RepID=A0AAV6UG22_9ARAC|nr:hypothetical protein JTE90_023404 [Oedothorax gibbosus]